jgi:hypothetical protein
MRFHLALVLSIFVLLGIPYRAASQAMQLDAIPYPGGFDWLSVSGDRFVYRRQSPSLWQWYTGDALQRSLLPLATAPVGVVGEPGYWAGAPIEQVRLADSTFVGSAHVDNGVSVNNYTAVFLRTSAAWTFLAAGFSSCATCGPTNYFFQSFTTPYVLNEGVALFGAWTRDLRYGLWTATGPNPAPLVRTGDAMPGGAVVTRIGYFQEEVAARQGGVAWIGSVQTDGDLSDRIYHWFDGTYRMIANFSEVLPGADGLYRPYAVAVSGENVAFVGMDSSFSTVLYLGRRGGPLQKVAQRNAPFAGQFIANPVRPCLAGETLFFQAGRAVFARLPSGTEKRLLGDGDVLDGRTLDTAAINTYGDAYSCDAGQLGVEVVFADDGSRALYRIPAPSDVPSTPTVPALGTAASVTLLFALAALAAFNAHRRS